MINTNKKYFNVSAKNERLNEEKDNNFSVIVFKIIATIIAIITRKNLLNKLVS